MLILAIATGHLLSSLEYTLVKSFALKNNFDVFASKLTSVEKVPFDDYLLPLLLVLAGEVVNYPSCIQGVEFSVLPIGRGRPAASPLTEGRKDSRVIRSPLVFRRVTGSVPTSHNSCCVSRLGLRSKSRL